MRKIIFGKGKEKEGKNGVERSQVITEMKIDPVQSGTADIAGVPLPA